MFGKIHLSLVGLIWIVSAAVFFYNRIKFYLNSVQATGRIIAVEPRSSIRRSFYCAKIESIDETGSSVTFVDGFGIGSLNEGVVGREVKVRYLPGATKSKEKLWTIPCLVLPPATFLVMGGAAFLAAFSGK